MNTVMIDGKEFDVAKLSPELQNYLVVRQEIQASKVRHNLELEKIEVLTTHYNTKIAELVKKEIPEEKKQMAAIANLTVDQGTSFTSDVTVKDANGNAFDLTGYTANAKMAKGFASTRTRTTITTTVAADATTGVVTLSLSSTVTAGLDAERYVYDLEITQTSSGNVTRVIEGIITVRPQVSI